MSKKKIITIIIIVVVVAIIAKLFSPLIYGAYIDLFVVEPYEEATWQDVKFFDKGYISVPNEWTYNADDEKILFYNSEGDIVLYAYKEHNTIPDAFPAMDTCDRYSNYSSMASGVFETSSNFFSLISEEGNYYFGTYSKLKYGFQYFGSLVASYDCIDEDTFRNILTSHRE